MFSLIQHSFVRYTKHLILKVKNLFSKLISLEGSLYVRNLLIILILDGLVLDDEPLWEPLEWSVMQTWVLYVYFFAWAAEVIFSSRYGSYTNRDKIVWIGLFKTYSLLKMWFIFNIIFITIFITLPFYFEITYAVSYSVVWWNWYTSVFFFKFVSIFTLPLVLGNILKLQIRWLPASATYIFLSIICFILMYLFYFTFITTLFAFFTDATEFKNSGWSNLSRVNHGPLKWGWGLESRDHFSYHRTTTVFWYKNDPLIAASMLFLNIFILKFLFFMILQTLAVIRVIYYSNECSFNFITYFVASLKQFLYFILSLSSLLLLSIVYQFIRFPFELYWFSKLVFLGELELEIISDFFFDIYHLIY